MKRSYIWLALGGLVALGAVLALPSCGHDSQLVGLQVMPAPPGFTFPLPNAGATGQYTAIGTYIHPPATKDVTSQATWAVDDGVVSINGGLVTTNGSCGSADVSATMPQGTGGASNIVRAYSFVTVDNPGDQNCPGGGTQSTLGVQVVGQGTVTSLVGGINCPSACIAPFPVGASVGLTAAPTGGGTVTWVGCTAFAGNSCTVSIPSGGANVLATFQ
jgi:hypothetical protein